MDKSLTMFPLQWTERSKVFAGSWLPSTGSTEIQSPQATSLMADNLSASAASAPPVWLAEAAAATTPKFGKPKNRPGDLTTCLNFLILAHRY